MKNLNKKEISKKLEELEIEHDINLAKEELIALIPGENEEEKEYIVVFRFKDLQDEDKVYGVGDIFDTNGKSEERVKELSSTKNKIGKILIEERE